MNFFGHAVVASWHAVSPEAHFGAMLPDFAGMVDAPMPIVRHPDIGQGVAHHHATDDVFHRTTTFRTLSNTAARHLESFGLRRGSALAVGHVGVELLIDCALGKEPAASGAYLDALSAGAPALLRGAIEWGTLEQRQRYERLHEVLSERGLGVISSDPRRLSLRLQRVLFRRPRLSISDDDCQVVEDWVRGVSSSVADVVPTLMDELREGVARLLRASRVAKGAAE